MLKLNEKEAAIPIAYKGGPLNYKFENGYDVRRGHNSHFESHHQKYLYSYDYVGGYEMQAAAAKVGSTWGDPTSSTDINNKKYINLGKTSLPYSNRESLGSGDVIFTKNTSHEKYKKDINDIEVYTNGDTAPLTVYKNSPSPASLNLLPLLRI